MYLASVVRLPKPVNGKLTKCLCKFRRVAKFFVIIFDCEPESSRDVHSCSLPYLSNICILAVPSKTSQSNDVTRLTLGIDSDVD